MRCAQLYLYCCSNNIFIQFWIFFNNVFQKTTDKKRLMFYLSCFCFMSCHLKEIEMQPTVYVVLFGYTCSFVIAGTKLFLTYACRNSFAARISPGKNKFSHGKIKVFNSKSPEKSWNSVLKICWPPWDARWQFLTVQEIFLGASFWRPTLMNVS